MGDYFERKLDQKRRLIMPTDLREEFKSGVVITRGFKKYLHLYPKEVWEKEVEPALAGDILDEEVADKNVRLRMGKSESDLDGKGRLRIEQHLLSYAGISQETAAIRVGHYWRLTAKGK